MIKWIVRKLGQLANWATNAQDIVQDNEQKFSAWSLADFGAGVAIGAVAALILL